MSNLRPLVGSADLWILGHVHDLSGYRFGNPRGYALNRLSASALADLRRKNPAFDPGLVIEI
ncbi:hypothetical protein [Paraburkholderia sp. EG304]|uniref:hypothetical protein n=1 Tax=Paraburkholderia sp. EG304 TaxID=3237015 RepID=UPI00397D8557